MAAAGLAGRRILVVAHDGVVAFEIAAALVRLGADRVRPVATTGAAWGLLPTIDGAVLDHQLPRETSLRLLRHLAGRGTPVVLVTASPARIASGELRRLRILARPFSTADLDRCRLRAFGGGAGANPVPEPRGPLHRGAHRRRAGRAR